MLGLVKKIIYLIFTFFIGLFIASSFFIRAKYNYFVYGDIPVLEKQKLGIFIFLIVALGLFSIALYKLCLKLNKYSKKVVIPVTLLFSFVIQIVIIFLFTRLPTDDSQTVLSLALNMLYNKDYSSFQTGGYLYMFPFNFSIVLYLKTLLAVFPDNYLVIKIFNILFSLVITLMIYLIYKEINYKSEENDYGVLVFAATYIPSLFMCNFIYNDIIATAFFTTAIYFAIKFVKEKSIKYIIGASVSLAIGNYFRSVGVIVLIASVIYILLSIKKIGAKKVITSLCILAVLFNVPGWAQNAVLKGTNIVTESVNKNSAPIYMWLNMGISKDKFGFWDDMQSYNIYQRQGNYNKEKSTELFKEEIKNKLSNMTFSDIAKMYYKKITWTWTEGTYQVERYGIGVQSSFNRGQGRGMVMGGYSYTTFATDLFKGNSQYRSGLLWILYVMNFLMYCFIFVRLISGIKAKRFDEVFLILVILGFIGFYILWEIKSRYIYPVYPLLIILSYMGFKDVYDFILKKYFSQSNTTQKEVIEYAKNDI
ncbi:glycosyltransferase family 39 protein [Clostridium sp. PL3]|uniref:Glycosyltransferase family 39 protein n=1 Tax=Clostridium thailandense TaxID=2794346 RepID=A0A949TFZ8_9CLOT|nr:glycosyltransferase family 39 protein [Clostridium thailandense]MBV7271500.1 glycosyltransferase family 39 protein [Clostridium thailandense]